MFYNWKYISFHSIMTSEKYHALIVQDGFVLIRGLISSKQCVNELFAHIT